MSPSQTQKIFRFGLNFLIPSSWYDVTGHKGQTTHTSHYLETLNAVHDGARYVDWIQLASLNCGVLPPTSSLHQITSTPKT